jgi:bla regulator protein blaR1
MMLQLPAGDIEAILLHELAHIRRRDSWVNMMQQIATLFYFFNPGLLWISSLISEERENCCDEMAIEKLGNGKSYISALLSFEELNQSSAPFVLAFPGRKNRLLQRVRRILYHQNQTLNTMEKMILAGCLLLIGLVPLAFSQPVREHTAIPARASTTTEPGKISAEQASAAFAKPASDDLKVQPAIEDTVPKKPEKTEKPTVITESVDKSSGADKRLEEIVYERDGYRIITREGKIRSAYYNGKKLTAEEIKKQNAELEKIMKKQALEWRNLKQAAEEDYAKMFAERKKMLEEITQNSKQALESKAMAELLASKLAIVEQAKQLQANVAIQQTVELKEKLAALQSQNLANLQNDNIKLQIEKETLQKLAKEYSSIYPVGRIIDMLMEQKIIDNTTELSFELSDEGFIVNNVKQPTSVHEEFKKAILKTPQDHVIYSVSKGSTHADISIKD